MIWNEQQCQIAVIPASSGCPWLWSRSEDLCNKFKLFSNASLNNLSTSFTNNPTIDNGAFISVGAPTARKFCVFQIIIVKENTQYTCQIITLLRTVTFVTIIERKDSRQLLLLASLNKFNLGGPTGGPSASMPKQYKANDEKEEWLQNNRCSRNKMKLWRILTLFLILSVTHCYLQLWDKFSL
jgi:hypothetical protein